MSNLQVGIVGLPNAGKSTLFNALASRRLAETAPRPFTTIDPHEAVVPVPDEYFDKLSEIINPEEKVPATVTFIDIAGLVKGAHKGEGLGNQFLSKIREVDAIIHVVRGFIDPYVSHQHVAHEPGTLNQVIYDIEIVNLELRLAGIKTKPTIYVINVGEQMYKQQDEVKKWIYRVNEKFMDPSMVISAKLEEELSDLDEKEKREYLNELSIKKTGLERLIKKAYILLNLVSFYTIKGGKETHAWSIKEGSSIIDAANKVHTDFAEKFIKAEVIEVDLLLKLKNWKHAKEKGKVKLEGRDYIVRNRDVIEFISGK